MIHCRFSLFAVACVLNFWVTSLAAQQQTTIPAGFLVTLETNEELSEKEISIGKSVKMRVRTPVVVHGEILVAIGAEGFGRISKVTLGDEEKAGYFTFEPISCLTVDGQTLFLNGRPQVVQSTVPGAHYQLEIGMSASAFTLSDVQIQTTHEPPVTNVVKDTLQPADPPFVATEPVPIGEIPSVMIAPGTEIPLVLSDECIPANVEVGATFRLRVKQDVIEHGKLVFRAKAPAVGRVKYITETHIFVVAVTVVAIDGQVVAVETDNSVGIEFDPDKSEEILHLDAEVPAMVTAGCTLSVR
jgi:hypothetical protein